MSLFFVDSSCDLDLQQIKSLGIECFQLPFVLNGEEGCVNPGFDYHKFYSKLRKGIVVSGKNLTEKAYIKIFEPALKMGDDIVYIHASEYVYNTDKLYDAKTKLLELYPDRKFEIVDSKNFSAGYGAVCFLLALAYHNGSTIDEIVEYYHEVKDTIATYFILDNVDNIPDKALINPKTMVGSALNIKTIVAITIDGKIKVVEKISGKKRAIMKLVQLVRQTGENVADNPIFVATSSSTDEIQYLEEKLKEYFGSDLKLFKNYITPTNASIVGNQSVGIAFRVHRKIN